MDAKRTSSLDILSLPSNLTYFSLESSESSSLNASLSSYEEMEDQKEETGGSSMLRLLGLVVVFVVSTLCLYGVWRAAPPSDLHLKLQFPKDLDGLREVADALELYRDVNLPYTVLLFSCAYLYKQMFAIPGSFFLNLLAGALFGVYSGCVLVCILNAVGASGCYIVSYYFMRPVVDRYFSHRLRALRRKIAKERKQLSMFLLGARILPFCPHWLLNICSPFAGVSLLVHFGTVFIGLIPYNVLCVRAGRVLADVRSVHDVFDLTTILELVVLAAMMVVIGFLSRRRQKNSEQLSSIPS